MRGKQIPLTSLHYPPCGLCWSTGVHPYPARKSLVFAIPIVNLYVLMLCIWPQIILVNAMCSQNENYIRGNTKARNLITCYIAQWPKIRIISRFLNINWDGWQLLSTFIILCPFSILYNPTQIHFMKTLIRDLLVQVARKKLAAEFEISFW